jgi:hypothetical protein
MTNDQSPDRPDTATRPSLSPVQRDPRDDLVHRQGRRAAIKKQAEQEGVVPGTEGFKRLRVADPE